MEVDLFGQPVEVRKPRKVRSSDIFSLDQGLSNGERWAIAKYIRELNATSPRDKLRLLAEADRFEHCRRRYMVYSCERCSTGFHVLETCKSRLCPSCQYRYCKDLEDQIKGRVGELRRSAPAGYRIMQVTLTVTSNRFGDGLPDRAGIKRLETETREFLQENFGRYKVRRSKSGKLVEAKRPKKSLKPGDDPRIWIGRGWVCTMEVGADNNNLHCHALVWGPFLPWGSLRDRWAKITGDSFGVDIRIKGLQEAVRYILKYLMKPPKTDSYARMADWLQCIRGSRRIRCGGVFYGRLSKLPREKLPCGCPICYGRLFFRLITDSISDSLDLFKAHKTPGFQAPATSKTGWLYVSGEALPGELPI